MFTRTSRRTHVRLGSMDRVLAHHRRVVDPAPQRRQLGREPPRPRRIVAVRGVALDDGAAGHPRRRASRRPPWPATSSTPTTDQPSAMSRSAMPRPMPAPAPVTTATRPVRPCRPPSRRPLPYPLTAPADRPRSMPRWAMSVRTSTGTTSVRDAAAMAPSRSSRRRCSSPGPRSPGWCRCPPSRNGMKYSLQAAMAMSTPTVSTPGQRQRQHDRQEARIRDAPSTRAASSISWGCPGSRRRTSRP